MNLGLFFFFTLYAQAANFGLDDRAPITPQSPANQLARSTAIAVLSANHSDSAPGFFRLDTDALEVCSDEKFADDPSLSWACTGFLVAPDIIATAGHCMVNTGESRNETETYCQAFSWLFDYQAGAQGLTELDHIPNEKLYGCEQVIYAVREEQAPFRDFALVQLDRAVTDRAPLKFSATPVQEGQALTMIGYPFGTPAKLSSHAQVLLNNPARESFITNLDAFEGNSGSPVFNEQNEVTGILVGGTPSISLVEGAAGTCSRYNLCDENGEHCLAPDEDTSLFRGFQRTGSEVQRIAPLQKALEDFRKL